ncbi:MULTISPECIES: hypothetical protein [Mycobacteroides]|uniref:Lipoprotein n=1 Tax=Mycobacteroides immunogenum TaxID=83262 RepID=A0ABR5LMF3_9MYCO|nr:MULTISPECIES: hypothetical protein [Mycobacteroides]KPG28269.1 hypothetical protein AN912_21980 [Mycobacteroides immunogenum]KPG28887.1 hypothetical protein AN913_13395 [Mycobacteroides immunogenum]KPG60474.1 hypothetical protein AN918_12375 [Mycobacteroides immunogenum]MBF9315225.1 hypothetical protein [Mycobacteroides chelonae]OHT74167.1 hypothetical protein BKG66_06130 [Mycobacteroides chelonae]
MNISKVTPVAACLLAAILATSGCQSVQQLYGDIRGTNPACTRIAEYTPQVHNKRSFVGLADNVFVGKVEASDGQHVEGRDFYSLFKVQVISNLKGQLSGQVTVSQIGGHFNGRECLQNDDEILRAEKTYLFTTVYSKNIDKHFIGASNYGDIELSDADVATLKNGAPPPVVLEFKDAIANQILAKGK